MLYSNVLNFNGKLLKENKGDIEKYEIRYRNSAAYFHISLYLHVTPQTRMVTVFLKIATL